MLSVINRQLLMVLSKLREIQSLSPEHFTESYGEVQNQ